MAVPMEEPKTMAALRGVGALSDLKNLFPTKIHFFIFVGYMALSINQGTKAELTPRWFPHFVSIS